MTRAVVSGLLLLLCSCGEGKLNIILELPSRPELDPLQDPRLAKFSLRIIQNGEATDQDAFRGDQSDLMVGEVPTDAPFDLRLAAKSGSDDMLGLGLVLDVRAAGDGETAVSVKFRKPIALVAGGGRLQALNAAGEPGSIELEAVPIPEVSEIAAAPTGVWVLGVAGTSLVPLRTADHQLLPAATLEEPGSCVTVSPDSRHAIVCHAAAVSVVPLDLIGSAEVRGRRLELGGGRPSRVAFGLDRGTAWVLLDGFTAQQTCPAGPSTVVQLEISGGRELRRLQLDRPVADLAVNPRDGGLLLALPCEPGGARLGRLDGDSVDPGVATPGALDIVVSERGIISIGAIAGRPVKVHAVIFDLAHGGLEAQPQTRDYVLPPLVVQFANPGSTSGFFAWISEGQQLRITEASVAPDGRRAVALFRASYSSNMSFSSCLFGAEVEADGYMLLDLASGSLLLQRYTSLRFKGCSANCLADRRGQSMADKSVCETEVRTLMQEGKILHVPEFTGSGSALLFGGS